MFHLIGKNIGLIPVVQVVVDHAPDGTVSRAGDRSDDFNCMLSVKNIVDPIPPAYLDWVNLVKIKVGNRTFDLCLGQRALVILIRYQISDRDQFKVDVWNKAGEIFH